MPAVTVLLRPNGLPIATTQSPTREVVGVAELAPSAARLRIDLQHREVGLRVASHDLGVELAAVVQRDGDLLGVLHHVVVGEDDAVLADDEARPRAVLREAAARRGGGAEAAEAAPSSSPNGSGGNPNAMPSSAAFTTDITLMWTTAGEASAASGANDGGARPLRGMPCASGGVSERRPPDAGSRRPPASSCRVARPSAKAPPSTHRASDVARASAS